MLTIKQLKGMEPGVIFKEEVAIDCEDGLFLAGTGKEVKWVAVRGYIHDWDIYADNPYSPQFDFAGVKAMGDKVTIKENIQKLVPCDEEAFKMYRY